MQQRLSGCKGKAAIVRSVLVQECFFFFFEKIVQECFSPFAFLPVKPHPPHCSASGMPDASEGIEDKQKRL